jgi:hypothetical protein
MKEVCRASSPDPGVCLHDAKTVVLNCRVQPQSRAAAAYFFSASVTDTEQYSGLGRGNGMWTGPAALPTPNEQLTLVVQAAVDVETDAMLQATLRSPMFHDRTIITIAHRINTILDSDRIVVLDHGSVAEFDTPSELVRRKGLFYELVREAGLLDSVVAPQ